MKVVLKHAGKWLYFQNPKRVLRAERLEDVLPMLREVEASRLFAAGFVSYEAAPAFDRALKTRPADGFPLLCLGLFRAPDVLEEIEEAPPSSFMTGDLAPSVTKAAFVSAIDQIKERIAEGATYQVNYTYRLHAGFSGDAWAFFYELVKAQSTEYAAFIDTGDFAICSASPELFFSLNNGVIVSRPMKGTAPRGRTLSEDWQQAEALQRSEKNRAENIMIVDMIRNDIGRVAEPGTVEMVSTFDVEKYPTVWQMTSTVRGTLAPEPRNRTYRISNVEDPSTESVAPSRLCEIFKALFPCASITGAPKAKTMELIRDLETTPRKVYTGGIGFMTPQGEACFSVAIRTALIDLAAGTLEYGVGGGVVWDSDAEAEYEETLTKARVLTRPIPDFQLLETMLWEPGSGIFLLEEHLLRLAKSAAYFDIRLDQSAIRQQLDKKIHTCAGVESRIRLLVSREGMFEMQAVPLEEDRACPPGALRTPFACAEAVADGRTVLPARRVAFAKNPVDSQDVFLFHKTTHRTVYENAKADFPDCDDVILWNERGEVTETTIANVVLRREDRLITPPVACGLLAGTFREFLLKSGEIREAVVPVDELKAAPEIFLINSLRKWQRAELE